MEQLHTHRKGVLVHGVTTTCIITSGCSSAVIL